jgi:hypothetical protein
MRCNERVEGQAKDPARWGSRFEAHWRCLRRAQMSKSRRFCA